MIRKEPTSSLRGLTRKGLKTFVVFEAALFAGSYLLWSRMNRSQDFRFYMHQHFPTILESYYMLGEKLSGNNDIRKFDQSTWLQKIQNEH